MKVEKQKKRPAGKAFNIALALVLVLGMIPSAYAFADEGGLEVAPLPEQQVTGQAEEGFVEQPGEEPAGEGLQEPFVGEAFSTTEDDQIQGEITEESMTSNGDVEGTDSTKEEAADKEGFSDKGDATDKAEASDEKDVADKKGPAAMPAFAGSVEVEGFEITVSAGEDTFPEGCTLQAVVVSSGGESVSDECASGENVALSYTFDIKVLDKDGKPVQPAEGKKVAVQFVSAKVADANLDTHVYHAGGAGTEELAVTTIGTVASAMSDGFSLYTVEFTYGDLQYVMEGDTTIPLSDVLTFVGLVGEPSAVSVSNPELFSVSDESGQWVLTAHQAFSSTEWMKATVDGVEYVITVTDAQTIPNSNVTWEISNGTLIIDGTGPMPNFTSSNIPWKDQKDSITSIEIRAGVTSIGNKAFFYCANLQSVTIPSSVTSIGDNAFYVCPKLQSAAISDGVTSIGNSAFSNCSQLQSITIPSSVTSIGEYAFTRCSNLENITIPSSVTSFGAGAFSYCANLQNVTISDGVTSIGNSAFSNCSQLENITIPSSVTSIGEYAFTCCSNLESITIPSSVTSIERHAFSNCSQLQSIVIPGSVTSIGSSAFVNCSSLQSVTISSGVTSVESSVFLGCSSLQSVTIPSSMTSIGENAFRDIKSTATVNGDLSGVRIINGGNDTLIARASAGAQTGGVTIRRLKDDATEGVFAGQLLYATMDGDQGDVLYYWTSSTSANVLQGYTGVDVFASTSISGQFCAAHGYGYAAASDDGRAAVIVCTAYRAVGDKLQQVGTGQIQVAAATGSTGDTSELASTLSGLNVLLLKGETGGLTVRQLLARAGVACITCSYVYMSDSVMSSDTNVVTITGTGRNAYVKPIDAFGAADVSYGIYTGGNNVCDYHGAQYSSSSPYEGTLRVCVVGAEATGVYTDAIKLTLEGLPSGEGASTVCTINDANHTSVKLSGGATGVVTFKGLTSGMRYQILIEVTDPNSLNGTNKAQATKTVTTLATGESLPPIEEPSITEQPSDLSWIYGDAPATTLSVTASVNDGTLSYQWYKDDVAIAGAISNNYTVPSGTETPAGDYTYKCVVTNTRDDESASKACAATVTVSPKEVGLSWGTTAFTYNGQQQVPTATATGLLGEDACTVTVTGAQTNAGDNYTATASQLSNGNYKLPSANTTVFSIASKSIVGADVSLNLPGNLVYDGNQKTVSVKSVALTDGGITTELQNNSDYTVSGDLTGTDADTYTLTVTGAGNYRDSVTAEWTISGTSPEIKVTPAAASITYGQALSDSALTGGLVKFGENEVAGTFEWKDGSVKPSVADSGTKSYTVVFKPDSSNFTLVECEVTLTVDPADAVPATVVAGDLSYNEKSQELVSVDNSTLVGGEMWYVLGADATTVPGMDADWSKAVPTGTDVSAYYVWYMVKGDENHKDSAPAVITAEVKQVAVSYSCLSGSESTWTKGLSDPLTFIFKRNIGDEKTFKLFKGVKVDGADVPELAYTATEGSLVLSMAATYLEQLSAGNHELTVIFEDSEVTAAFSVKAVEPKAAEVKGADTKALAAGVSSSSSLPNTSDSNALIELLLLVTALLALVLMVSATRKKRCPTQQWNVFMSVDNDTRQLPASRATGHSVWVASKDFGQKRQE